MILSFGCSHSMGPYDKNDRHPRFLDADVGTEVREDWPSRVYLELKKHNPDIMYRHISLQGFGILTYVRLLEYMNDHCMLNQIDKLLIQVTHELRLCISTHEEFIDNQRFCEKYTSSLTRKFKNDPFVFTKHTIPLYNMGSYHSFLNHAFMTNEFTKRKPSSAEKLRILEFTENVLSYFSISENPNIIFNLCLNRIKELCKINDIEYYDFAWAQGGSKESKTTEHLKNKPLVTKKDFKNVLKDDMIESIMKEKNIPKRTADNYFFNTLHNPHGHFMEDGEKMAQDFILKYLYEDGFFNV